MPRLEDLPPLPLPLEGWQPPPDGVAAAADAGKAGAADGGEAAGVAAAGNSPSDAAEAAAAAVAAGLPVGGFLGLLGESQTDAAVPAEQQEQKPAAGAAGSAQSPHTQIGGQVDGPSAQPTLGHGGDGHAPQAMAELHGALLPQLSPEEQAPEEPGPGSVDEQHTGHTPAGGDALE